MNKLNIEINYIKKLQKKMNEKANQTNYKFQDIIEQYKLKNDQINVYIKKNEDFSLKVKH